MSGAARLTSTDVGSLCRETSATPQHLGWMALFEAPAGGFDYDRLLRLLRERISLAPRYRQRLRTVPANLAHPVWVDDPRFDITYHVRRSALPRPGTEAQLLEFAAQVQSRLLDRDRPLWEMYLVEGLGDGRTAVITKVHQALVDGAGTDIAEVLLDASPAPRRAVHAQWVPSPEPASVELLADAVRDAVRRPGELARSVAQGAWNLRAVPPVVTALVGGALRLAGSALGRENPSPLQAGPGQRRRLVVVRTRLADYRQVRDVLGGTVNDVVLATVTGALRAWLLSRGEQLAPHAIVRALVPVGLAAPGERGHVSALLVDLPVGEADAARRLAHVRYTMAAHTDAGRGVAADVLASLSGFAPPTLHALGVRAGSELARRLYSLVISNVPGPQVPLYAAGARMSECAAFLPLDRGQALSIGLTSYDGGVRYGIAADHQAVPDLHALAGFVVDALAELSRVAAPGCRPGSRPRDGGSGHAVRR